MREDSQSKKELPAEDAAERAPMESTVYRAAFLICCPADYEDAVFAVASSMITVDDRLGRLESLLRQEMATSADLSSLESSKGWIILEKLYRKEPTEEELYTFAASISDTISADAMCRALIGYDRPATSSLEGRPIAAGDLSMGRPSGRRPQGGGDTLEGRPSSETQPDTGVLPVGIKNAMTAVHIGLKYNLKSPILPYFGLGLSKLVYALPEAAAREYIRDNLGNFRFSDLDAETLNTIYTFFDTGLSLAKTARQLFIHRNTLNYRIDKFERLSGLNLRKFDDAVVCQIAMLIGDPD